METRGGVESEEERAELSVVLGDTLAALDGAPEDLPDDASWGVAGLMARLLRNEEDQEIRRSPVPESQELRDRAHGDVVGAKGQKRRRRLKKHAWWVIEPAVPPNWIARFRANAAPCDKIAGCW